MYLLLALIGGSLGDDDTDCKLERRLYRGTELSTWSGDHMTSDVCNHYCEDEGECQFWSFHETKKSCKLFQDTNRIIVNGDYTSGPKGCGSIRTTSIPPRKIAPYREADKSQCVVLEYYHCKAPSLKDLETEGFCKSLGGKFDKSKQECGCICCKPTEQDLINKPLSRAFSIRKLTAKSIESSGAHFKEKKKNFLEPTQGGKTDVQQDGCSGECRDAKMKGYCNGMVSNDDRGNIRDMCESCCHDVVDERDGCNGGCRDAKINGKCDGLKKDKNGDNYRDMCGRCCHDVVDERKYVGCSEECRDAKMKGYCRGFEKDKNGDYYRDMCESCCHDVVDERQYAINRACQHREEKKCNEDVMYKCKWDTTNEVCIRAHYCDDHTESDKCNEDIMHKCKWDTTNKVCITTALPYEWHMDLDNDNLICEDDMVPEWKGVVDINLKLIIDVNMDRDPKKRIDYGRKIIDEANKVLHRSKAFFRFKVDEGHIIDYELECDPENPDNDETVFEGPREHFESMFEQEQKKFYYYLFTPCSFKGGVLGSAFMPNCGELPCSSPGSQFSWASISTPSDPATQAHGGRIVVHEVGHMLGVQHTPDGIMVAHSDPYVDQNTVTYDCFSRKKAWKQISESMKVGGLCFSEPSLKEIKY